MLTGLDFQKEGIGFYMVFGSLGMLPLLLLQSRYLAAHPPTTMPQYCLIPAVLLNGKFTFSADSWIMILFAYFFSRWLVT